MKSDDTTLFPGGEGTLRATVGFSPEADGAAPASVGAEAVNFKDMSTPALAYLGDCVLELFVRDALVRAGLSSAKTLNARAMDFVRAPVQAAARGIARGETKQSKPSNSPRKEKNDVEGAYEEMMAAFGGESNG